MLRTRTVLAAVLLVVAFGLAAGSLPSSGGAPAASGGDGPDDGRPPSDAAGNGSGEPGVENPVSGATRDRLLVAVVALALAVGYVFVPTARRTVAVAAGVVAVAAASYAWFRPATVDVLSSVADAASSVVGGPLGVGLAGVLALAVVVTAWRAFGRDEQSPREPESVDGDPGRDDADATGPRAVDVHPATRRASNEVARAWQRAVASVSMPAPGARTPREFLRATERVDANAFERLTELFERVRYGDVDPAPEGERARSLAARAVANDGGDVDDDRTEEPARDGSNGETDGRASGGGGA
ncbi:DUF4129 domain-containing protein [Halorubellus sp. PRR65]|uniref:DUF4129 domain-containing protein n=1 Tax=Halorubellus sp. PRR65 TaxID=3098148 RepID=UPI002B2633ED|nr:DUF4129 domain-containing protein [Halorubellus sp. PRR65]